MGRRRARLQQPAAMSMARSAGAGAGVPLLLVAMAMLMLASVSAIAAGDSDDAVPAGGGRKMETAGVAGAATIVVRRRRIAKVRSWPTHRQFFSPHV